MSHPYVHHELYLARRRDLLREAEAERLLKQAQPVNHNPIAFTRRAVNGFGMLLMGIRKHMGERLNASVHVFKWSDRKA